MTTDRVLLICEGSIDPGFRPYQPPEWFDPDKEPSLSSHDIMRAMRLPVRLRSEFGIQQPGNMTVAVSESPAARQTARYGGFTDLVDDERLNPLDLGDPFQQADAIRTGQLPAAALKAVKLLLENPPEVDAVIAPASLIGALFRVRQQLPPLPNRAIPDACDIWSLDL